MGELKDSLRERLQSGIEIGEDTTLTTQEAIQAGLDNAREEYARGKDYAQCRKKRKQDVAKRLHETRKNCGMKQQDVADKTGINVITLSGYEVGRSEPNMEALVRLADVYKVSADYLLCREEKPKEA